MHEARQLIGWEKALRANDRRKTRFHTERGEFVGLRGLLEYPGLVLRRFRGGAILPWMVSSAVRAIADSIPRDAQVLEFGSGNSTAWFAQRARLVLSLEYDERWAAAVRARLANANVANCDLRVMPLAEVIPFVQGLPDDSFDLIVVDNHETAGVTRLDCLMAARTKVKPGGILVLDDSDRAAYGEAPALLPGWTRRSFVGAKPQPLMSIETTLFVRPRSTPVRSA
jgi:SAM-dependent methyltransferase